MLDEAQDVLRRSYLEVLDLSLNGGLSGGHWRFFGDFTWQRIYDPHALTVDELLQPPAEARAAGAEVISAARCALRINCRNTPRVAALAVACGHVQPGYKRVRRPDDEVEPEVLWYADGDEQLELLRSAHHRSARAGLRRPARRRHQPPRQRGLRRRAAHRAALVRPARPARAGAGDETGEAEAETATG